MKQHEPKILHLTLTKKWFDLTASGKKPRDFRLIKDYWVSRFLRPPYDFEAWDELICDLKNPIRHTDYCELLNYFGMEVIEYDEVHYRNGYRKDSPFCRIKWAGLGFSSDKSEKPINGEKLKETHFSVKNGPVLETRNWSPKKPKMMRVPQLRTL